MKVGDLIKDIRYGFTGSAIPERNGTGFIRVTDIDEFGKVDYSKVPGVIISEKEVERYLLEDGDCIIARSGSVGKAHIYFGKNSKEVFASYLIRLRFDTKKILPRYFGAFTHSEFYWKQILSNKQGGVQQNINTDGLSRIEIPLPNLKTQQKIASILEQADTARQQRKQASQLTEQFLQSAFLEMFGDPVRNEKGYKFKKLGDVAIINMGQSPSGDSYNSNGKGKPLLNGPTEFGIKFPKEKQWTTKPTKFSKIGDILFCVRGATAGRMNWSDKEYCIGRGLAAIYSKGEVPNNFIYKFLEMKYSYFQNLGQGSTFINLNKDLISDLLIPFPPLPLQQKFAALVQQVEQLREKQRESERELENLFGSLMGGYFG